MPRIALPLIGAMALVLLSGCYYPYGYYDRYGSYNGGPYGYDTWYDGYYGPYYGGYWGPEGDFYYYDSDRRWHRDRDRHFRHEDFAGARQYHSDHYDRDRDRDRDNDRDYRD